MIERSANIMIADGGIETALEDRLGQELPEFAAFVLLETEPGRAALREYYRPYDALARTAGVPLVVDTPTWRANPDWGAKLGYTPEALTSVIADATALVRTSVADSVIVNGCVGPRYDDYVASERMSPGEAERYHGPQVRAFADAGIDRITSVTTLDAAEGIGVVNAAAGAHVPVYVSFVVGEDGHLADGATIADAIDRVDRATDAVAAGFLVNCAHPSEVARGLADAPGAAALERLVGFRLNAARAQETGAGDDPATFAAGELALRELAPNARLVGGCCGTDVPHISALIR